MGLLIEFPSLPCEHPIDVLEGCHQRILRHCAIVERLAERLSREAVDAEARDVARAAIRYFDSEAANHHRDEEMDLFPMLEHFAPGRELNAVRSLVRGLRADHAELETLWDEIRLRLQAVTYGSARAMPVASARRFADAYARHIALEETELLPLARRVLDVPRCASLGRSMARRSGAARAS